MSSLLIHPLATTDPAPDWLEIVRQRVESLSFGVVQIIVHDRKVTQVERTEKIRLGAAAADLPRRRENY